MMKMDDKLYYQPPKKKHNPIRFLVAMLLFAIILFVGIEIYRLYASNLDTENSNINSTSLQQNTNSVSSNTNSAPPPAKIVTTIPEKANLKVPFTTQAPLVNWDALHEEACEEASLIMYKHFLKGTDIESPNTAEKEIQDLVAFEEQNGYKIDVTVSELNEIAKKYYGIKSGRIIKNATLDDIKQEIASGRPVIIPAAGKMLQNPNFKNGGPVYHMLVVKGYDKDGFVTNDPGTRKGEYYRYSFDILYNAIHDWDSNDITNGGKNVLVFD